MFTLTYRMAKKSGRLAGVFTFLTGTAVFGQTPYPQQPPPPGYQYPQQPNPPQPPPGYSQQPPPQGGYSQQPPPAYSQQPPPGYGQQPTAPYGVQPAPYGQPAAGYPQQPPPYFPPAELDRVVSRIALYPDPLLAQVMAAATFSDQIPTAAQWSDQHHYLTGDSLAAAINADQLPWDPSVQALLPFPNILSMMASDPAWSHELGDAFLAQQPEVMDAVQRERRKAYDYGYLRSNNQIVVNPGPQIAIAPVNPGYVVVPYYDPGIVYYPPRPGIVVAGAIGFNFGISLGAAFRPWGWGYNRFDWGGHAVIINNYRWGRTWGNRFAYVHPYEGVHYSRPGPGYRAAPVPQHPESHTLHSRDEQERGEWRGGHPHHEDHPR